MKVADLVRKNIKDLVPYSAARYEFSGTKAILMDANENPYGQNNNRYPDPWQSRIKDKLAQIHGIDADEIFIGNGADEAIDLLIRAFCEPDTDSILVHDPTYSMYDVSAQINGSRVIKVQLNEDFSLNTDAILKAVEKRTKLMFLCTPLNPSGNLLDKNSILQIIKNFHGLVVIDEAYIDFSDDEGFVPFIRKHCNLVVLQTFSKARGLAGIRVGMAFSNPEIIQIINRIKPPYNVSGPAQALALKSLEDQTGFYQTLQKIIDQRSRLRSFLEDYPLCEKVFPSEANFLLARFSNSSALYQFLKSHLLIVRDRSFETHCRNCLRITVGTEEENQTLTNLLLQYEKEAAVS